MQPPQAQHHRSPFWIKASEETQPILVQRREKQMGCFGKGGVAPYRDEGAWRSSDKVPTMGVPSSLSLLSIGNMENFSRAVLCLALKVLFVPSCKFPVSTNKTKLHTVLGSGCRWYLQNPCSGLRAPGHRGLKSSHRMAHL